ncbi:hypothetical protein ACP275_09G142100 [Erythranthe tilingii]
MKLAADFDFGDLNSMDTSINWMSNWGQISGLDRRKVITEIEQDFSSEVEFLFAFGDGLGTEIMAEQQLFSGVQRRRRWQLRWLRRDSKKQVTTAAADALNLLKDVQVDAIIGPQTSAQANFVIGLGGAAKVPVISFTATSPSLRPQTPYFVQAAINDAAQVDAIAAIVKYFHWYRIIFVYEDSDYGNGIIPYLSNAFQEVNARVSYRSVIPVSANDDFIIEELRKMKNMQTRVFVVHTTTPLASKIFLKAKEAEMMSEGYVWIVTSGLMNLFYSLDNPRIVESMQGVVGVKPFVPRSGKLKSTTIRWQKKFAEINPGITPPPEINLFGLWAYDTLSALGIAAEKVGFREPTYLQNTTALNSTNIFTTGTSQTGPKLLPEILGTEFEGLAGNFKLVNGQLQPSSFQILNVHRKKLRQVGIWTPLLPSSSSQRNANMTGFLGEELDQITWPGKSRNIPKGWEVSVSGEKLKVGVPAVAGFPEFVNTTNATNITGLYIDLFKSVMAALPYAVEYEFARFVKPDGSSAGSYDDLSQKVLYGEYDIVIGDITITANRSEYVDFSIPIEQGGVTRTQKIQYDDKINSELFFLKPLEKELWLTAIALFIFTGLALWILEHRVNKAFRGPASEHVGLIFYIPFMSLVFANKFTTAKLEKDHTDVSELIRNNDYVGCRNGSFVFELLKDLGFNESYIRVYKRPEELDEALSKGSEKGGIKAMFSPTPYTNLFLSKYRNKYMKVGSPYLSEGFAFAFPKGSPLVADVSRAIIKLTDNHTISGIKANWTSQFNDDGPSDSSSTPISLRSFTVLFAITGGVTGACLVVFLVSYLYKNRDLVQRISSSEMTTWSKLRAMSKHFDQRDPNSFRSGEYASSRHQNPVPAEEIPSENEDNVCPNSDRITEEDAHGSSSVQVENSRVV